MTAHASLPETLRTFGMLYPTKSHDHIPDSMGIYLATRQPFSAMQPYEHNLLGPMMANPIYPPSSYSQLTSPTWMFPDITDSFVAARENATELVGPLCPLYSTVAQNGFNTDFIDSLQPVCNGRPWSIDESLTEPSFNTTFLLNPGQGTCEDRGGIEWDFKTNGNTHIHANESAGHS